MADIRIKDLPTNASPNANQFVGTDLTSLEKLTIQDLVNTGAPIASQAEAEAGTNATKRMTPLTTKQAIDQFSVTVTDIGVEVQAYSADLEAIADLTSAADKVPYSTGSETWALADFTAAGRALLDDADAAAQRVTLGLEIGADVQAYDANLDTLAGITPGTVGQDILADETAADARTTLGLGTAAVEDVGAFATAAQGATADTALQPADIGVDVQAFDTDLAAIAALTSAANKLPYATGAGTWALTDLTAAGRAFLGGGELKMHILSGITGSSRDPLFNMNIQEELTTGTNFFLTAAIVGEKLSGATGHRTAFYVTQGSSVSEAGKFIVGIQGTAIARSGSSGSFFGLNGYSEILAGALTTAECIGGEYNTSVRNASVLRKVGLHIADVDGSTGAGTTFDAGLMFLRSSDSIGWSNGIHFSTNSGAGFPIKSTGKILRSDAGSVEAGIDLSALTISGKAFHSNQFFVEGSGKLQTLGVYARAGSAGTVRANVFNVDWDGTNPLLYVDSTSLGQIVMSTATSNSANTGGAAALPALPAGYMTIKRDGVSVKVPYYVV